MTIMSLAITIIISLLSGFAGTFYLEFNRKKSQKQKLSNCLILLYTEISDHSFWLKKRYSSNEAFISCSKLLRDAPTKEWDNVKYFLAKSRLNRFVKDADHVLNILMKDRAVKEFVQSTIEKESKEQNSNQA